VAGDAEAGGPGAQVRAAAAGHERTDSPLGQLEAPDHGQGTEPRHAVERGAGDRARTGGSQVNTPKPSGGQVRERNGPGDEGRGHDGPRGEVVPAHSASIPAPGGGKQAARPKAQEGCRTVAGLTRTDQWRLNPSPCSARRNHIVDTTMAVPMAKSEAAVFSRTKDFTE